MLFFQSVFSFLSFLEKFLSICIQNWTCNCNIFETTSTVHQHSFCLSNCVADQLHQLRRLYKSVIQQRRFAWIMQPKDSS
jgi:hypothetical protein